MKIVHRNTKELNEENRIPHGVLQFVRVGDASSFPTYSERGGGSYIWDADGKCYLDMLMGKGTVTLGHAYAPVDNAASSAATRGVCLGLCPPEAIHLANQMAQVVQGAEKSIFLKNGEDAVNAALRLARVFTNRELVLSCGYHGWQDAFLPGVYTKVGVPAAARCLIDFGYNLNRLEELCEKHGDDIAAVMVTPEPSFFRGDFLRAVACLARSVGALVIVDEIRCGFHFAEGGAHAKFGVAADLMTFSKGIANGYPLSVLSGRADVMEASSQTYIFGTYFFEASSLAAAIVAIDDTLRFRVVEHMWDVGQRLMEMLDAIFLDEGIPAQCLGPAPMFHMLFEDERAEDLFFAEMAARGVLFFPKDNQTISWAHGDAQICEIKQACVEAVKIVRKECYGNRKILLRELSPSAFSRYEARRLIEIGQSDRSLIELSGDADVWT